MTTKEQSLWLIDEAPLALALETSGAGRLWRAGHVAREQGTGRDLVRIEASDGAEEQLFEFRGPTMIGLGDADLERERERMTRIVQAAGEALAAIEAHLAFRGSFVVPGREADPARVQAPEAEPAAAPEEESEAGLEAAPHVAALERRGRVQLTLFPAGSRFVEVRWTVSAESDGSVRAHADRFAPGSARANSPLELVLDRAGADDHLAGLMELDSHVRWLDQEPPATPAPDGSVLEQRSFPCAAGGTVAGTVTCRLPRKPGERHRIVLTGFSLTGDAEWSVDPEKLSALRTALFCGNVRALWRHDRELAPFFCPDCGACYAASVWQAHHLSATRVDGVCPSGHRRRLCAD